MKHSTTHLVYTNKLVLLVLLFIASLPFASCKKDAGGSSTSNTDLLTRAAWKVTATEWLTTDGRWVSPPSNVSVANPGETLTLLSGHTFTTGISSGSAGTWQLSTDRSQLIMIDSKGTSKTLSIAELTASVMQLTTPLDPHWDYVIEGSGSSKTYIYCTTERTTFSH